MPLCPSCGTRISAGEKCLICCGDSDTAKAESSCAGADAETSDQPICVGCGTRCERGQEYLQCSDCSEWWHSACATTSAVERRSFVAQPASFTCNSCRSLLWAPHRIPSTMAEPERKRRRGDLTNPAAGDRTRAKGGGAADDPSTVPGHVEEVAARKQHDSEPQAAEEGSFEDLDQDVCLACLANPAAAASQLADEHIPNEDPRESSIESFTLFVAEVDRYRRKPLSELEDDQARVPIAVNTGTAGSGKTTQLEILRRVFENRLIVDPATGAVSLSSTVIDCCIARSIYVTLNGESLSIQDFDKHLSTQARVVRRVIHAAAVRGGRTAQNTDVEAFWCKIDCKYPAAVMSKLLKNGEKVICLCRSLVGIAPGAPLLIAFDELAKFDTGVAVGELSEKCVEALQALAALGQAGMRMSVASRVPTPNTYYEAVTTVAPVFILASAYAAYDPAMGVTYGSNRPVFYLPLPPLDLSYGYDKSLTDGLVKKLVEQMAPSQAEKELAARNTVAYLVARSTLWMKRGNARAMSGTFDRIMDVPSNDLSAVFTKQFFSDQFRSASSSARCREFIEACTQQKLEPADLLVHLFWPSKRELDEAFSKQRRVDLFAEAAGICSIIRDEKTSLEAIYMNPAAAKELCVQLGLEENPVAAAVALLCDEMMKLPELPGSINCGKQYKRIMHRAFACRMLTCESIEISLLGLLGGVEHSPEGKTADALAKLMIDQSELQMLREVTLPCFPRAAATAHEVCEVLCKLVETVNRLKASRAPPDDVCAAERTVSDYTDEMMKHYKAGSYTRSVFADIAQQQIKTSVEQATDEQLAAECNSKSLRCNKILHQVLCFEPQDEADNSFKSSFHGAIPDAPFFAQPTLRYNHCCDHLVRVRSSSIAPKKSIITMLFQEKLALSTNVELDGIAVKLQEELSNKRNKRLLGNTEVVLVVVTPDDRAAALAESLPSAVDHVVLVTHDSIRQWCPMVAYSACDALACWWPQIESDGEAPSS